MILLERVTTARMTFFFVGGGGVTASLTSLLLHYMDNDTVMNKLTNQPSNSHQTQKKKKNSLCNYKMKQIRRRMLQSNTLDGSPQVP